MIIRIHGVRITGLGPRPQAQLLPHIISCPNFSWTAGCCQPHCDRAATAGEAEKPQPRDT